MGVQGRMRMQLCGGATSHAWVLWLGRQDAAPGTLPNARPLHLSFL